MTGLTISLLGGVRAVDDSGERSLSQQTQRLLAALAVSRGLPVPIDTVWERLWEDLPRDPQTASRVALNRAREQLGTADVIERTSSGLRLTVDLADVDLWRFQVAAQQCLGDQHAGASDFEACREIWTGDPFGVFGSLPFALSVSTHLLELHRSVEERWVDALIDDDRNDEAVAASQRLVREEPLREGRWASLMRSLVRLGRRTEALRAYQEARESLIDATGLGPGTELIQLERRILDDDSSLLTRRTVSSLGVELAHLERDNLIVGRAEALDRLCGAPSGSLAVVIGEPGVGKSALLRAFCELKGSQRPVGSTPLSVVAPERPVRPAATLCALVDELVGRSLVSSADEVVQTLTAPSAMASPLLRRDQLVERATDLLSDVAAQHELIVVIDDAHWIDRLSAEVIGQVAARGRVTIVLSTRTNQSGQHERLLDGAVVAVDLAGLDLASTRELLQRIGAGSALIPYADLLHDRSGGNPLFLRLLIDQFAQHHVSVDASLSSLRSVDEAVTVRLSSLSSRTVESLRTAAVFGRHFRVAELCVLRPSARTDLLEALDARLLTVSSDGETYSFLHGLVQEAVVNALTDARRVELSDDISRLLEDRGLPAAAFVELAFAASGVDPQRAISAGARAGLEFEVRYAYDESMSVYQRALTVLDRLGLSRDHRRAELLIAIGRVRRRSGLRESRAILIEGIELADDLKDYELFATGVMELCSHGETTFAGKSDLEAAALLDKALSLPLEIGLMSRVCAAAATVLGMSYSSARGRQLFLRAWDSSRSVRGGAIERDVLLNTHLGLSHFSDLGRRIEAVRRLRQLSGTDPNVLWECAFLDFGNALLTADREGLDESMAMLRDLTPTISDRPRDFGLAFTEASYAHAIGDLDGAEEHVERAVQVGLEKFDPSWVMMVYSGIRLSISIDRGTVVDLLPTIKHMTTEMPEFEAWHCVAAFASFQAGNRDDALQSLRHALRDEGSHVPRDLTWSASLMCAARTAAGLGHEPMARWLYRELAVGDGRMSWGGACTYGPIDLGLSLLASSIGDDASALRHARVSDQLARQLGCTAYVGSHNLMIR